MGMQIDLTAFFDFLSGLAVFGVVVLIGIIGVLAYIILGYIIGCMGLYGMAKRRNLLDPYLAWIPIAQLFIVERLIGSMNFIGHNIEKIAIWIFVLVGSFFITSALTVIPLVGAVFGVLNLLILITLVSFIFTVAFNLYKLYKPESAGFYLILTILGFGFIPLFLLRKKQPKVQNEDDVSKGRRGM